MPRYFVALTNLGLGCLSRHLGTTWGESVLGETFLGWR
jgi:hypothetical protein